MSSGPRVTSVSSVRCLIVRVILALILDWQLPMILPLVEARESGFLLSICFYVVDMDIDIGCLFISME